MERLESIPEHIKSALARHEVWPAEIRLVAASDLSPEGEFTESWVVLTQTALIVMSGQSVTASGPRLESRRRRAAKRSVEWKEHSYASYPFADIEMLSTEGLVSGGMLTAKISGDEQVICRYSNTFARKFGIFAKLFGKLKEGKELSDEDFRDERGPEACPKCGMLYPDPSRKVCPRCLDKRSLFRRVMSFAPRYKGQIALILTCMFASSALRLTSPYLSGRVFFDEVLGQGGKYQGKVVQVVLLMAATQLFALLISIVYGRVNAGMTADVVYDLKAEVFTAMQRLSLSFFNSKQTGTLMTRVNNDANNLQYFFHDGLPYFIVNLVSIVGIGVAMVLMDWRLAILVLIPAPFIVWAMKVMFPKLWNLFSRRFRKTSFMNALINDTLTGFRVVKAFGKESSEVSRFGGANHGVYSVSMDVGTLINTMFPLLSFAMGIGGLIIWGVGGLEVARGQMSFGTMMTFIGYIGMIYGPLEFMTHIVDWWSSCMNSAQRIFEILDATPEVAEAKDPVRMPKIRGDIVLKGVTFSYEPNKPVLHDINLDVKAGEVIGLVGHSGAGKSTITNLITRLYDVEEGEISIDGVNIKDIAIKDLRSQIGMVLQETFLFSGSIAENIAYARPEASMAEIVRAAKIANAHDFIVKLPDGYDTVIGKRGHDLSGGERQRLSIARAILHDPRILILDEATASVDTETERQIQEALERLVKGRTTFAIAHRLSTLRNADRLVVLEKGKIVEIGTHAELVKLKGVYYNLLQKQREALKIRGVGE